MPWGDDVQFSLLGPLEVRDDDGRPVDLGSRRQRALLAMLLLDADRTVAVDRLVDGLWGESPPAKAMASLQAYVSNLRRALEPDRAPRAPARVLVSRAPGYAIVVDRSQVDVLRFEDHLAAAAGSDPAAALAELDAALALWRGPVLGDAHDDPFAGPEVARLEAARWGAEEDRVDRLLELGRTGDALTSLERLVARDPLRERPQHQLVVALYRAGRQVDALEAHRRHVAVLAEEFGLDPSPAFLALRDAVLRHELSGTLAAAPATAPTRGGPRPVALDLVGRDDELEHLRAVLARAREGVGTVVLVSGEPGIGKTRLLEAVLDEATRSGMLAALGRCYEGGGAPAFWPFVEVARGLQAVAPPELALLVDDLLAHVRPEGVHADTGDGLADAIVPASRFLVADRLTSTLSTIADRQPLAIGLDDVYGADPDSLDALVRLGAAVATSSLVVVATLRTTTLPAGHPLSMALGDLVRLSHVERVAPRALGPDEVRRLLARESGADPDPDTAARVHERTGGNPFFAVEMGRLLRLDGADPACEVPPGVRDVVRLRLERLPTDTVRTLRAAAVQGRSFDPTVVATVRGVDLAAVTAHLEEAIAAQLVSEDTTRPGTHRFSHVLVQEAIVDTLTGLRRAELHRATAEALRPAAGDRPELWARVAHHAAAAVPMTGPGPAVPPLASAALHAVTVNAHELAQQLVEQRIGLVAALPEGRDRDLVELQAQADLCAVLPITQGWHAPALRRAGERVVALAERLDDLDAEMRGLSSLSAQTTVAAQYQRTIEVLSPRQQEIFAATGDPAHGFIASHAIAMVHLFTGDLEAAARAYERSEELVRLADPGDAGRLRIPPDRMAGAAHHAGLWATALWMRGDRDRSRAQLARAHAIASRDGHLQTMWAVWLSHLITSYCDQDAHDVVAGDQRRRDEAGAFQSPVVDAMIGVPAAWGVAVLGDEGAVDVVRGRIDALTSSGALVFAALFRGMLADALLHHGRDEDALSAAEDGLAHADRLGERMWEAELHRLRAVALRRVGRRADAVHAVDRAIAVARAQGAVLLEARAEASAGQAGAGSGSSPSTPAMSSSRRS